MPRDLVLGSGPSGVAAAAALIARGREVVMLDAGGTMEPGAAALRARMGSQEPQEWTAEDRAAIRQSSGESDGIDRFGSDFVFRTPEHEPLWAEHSDVHALRPSFAKGGLSNGWGAAALPYRDEDMDAWPIRAGDLAPHYAAVAPMLQLAGRKDDLAAIFPAYAHPADRPLPPSSTGNSTARPPFDRSARLCGPWASISAWRPRPWRTGAGNARCAFMAALIG